MSEARATKLVDIQFDDLAGTSARWLTGDHNAAPVVAAKRRAKSGCVCSVTIHGEVEVALEIHAISEQQNEIEATSRGNLANCVKSELDSKRVHQASE
jgi:hypothetical protein